MFYLLFFFPQNAGEGPTEHVQKGAAADRLYGVSLGTTDQRIVTQKPHRYKAACFLIVVFPGHLAQSKQSLLLQADQQLH